MQHHQICRRCQTGRESMQRQPCLHNIIQSCLDNWDEQWDNWDNKLTGTSQNLATTNLMSWVWDRRNPCSSTGTAQPGNSPAGNIWGCLSTESWTSASSMPWNQRRSTASWVVLKRVQPQNQRKWLSSSICYTTPGILYSSLGNSFVRCWQTEAVKKKTLKMVRVLE